MHVISAAAFALALLAIVSFVFQFPISALFATSSIVAVVLGFALQSTLMDLMSGIALHFEKPFSVGQWITVGEIGNSALGGRSGFVVEMNWRATRLRLKSGDLVVYPNSMLTRSRIVNYTAPTPLHRAVVEIKLDNDESPAHATEVLRAAAMSAEGVLRQPRPKAVVTAFGDWSITYRVSFWIDDFAEEKDVTNGVYTAIWNHLSWAGLSRPIPRSAVSYERARPGDERADLARLLGRMSVFAPLTESERVHLAGELRAIYVPHGTRLIAQGDLGRSLFIVREGIFGIIASADGHERQVAELHPGEYFGEASLLTGAPRNASVDATTDAAVFELDKDAVAALLLERSEVADELARALAEREAARTRATEAKHELPSRGALKEAADRIRGFLLGDRTRTKIGAA